MLFHGKGVGYAKKLTNEHIVISSNNILGDSGISFYF